MLVIPMETILAASTLPAASLDHVRHVGPYAERVKVGTGIPVNIKLGLTARLGQHPARIIKDTDLAVGRSDINADHEHAKPSPYPLNSATDNRFISIRSLPPDPIPSGWSPSPALPGFRDAKGFDLAWPECRLDAAVPFRKSNDGLGSDPVAFVTTDHQIIIVLRLFHGAHDDIVLIHLQQ